MSIQWSEKHEAWYRENSLDLRVFREQREYKFLNVQPSDRVLDLGGHIGAFTLTAARAGAQSVVSFEPEEENFELLMYNTLPYKQCKVIRAAVVPDPAPTAVDFYVVVPPVGKK